MSKLHADASPSSSNIWINCPASVTKARGRVRQATSYTREGSAAHHIAELKLNGTKKLPKKVTIDGEEIEVTQEMLDAVDTYVSYVRKVAKGNSFAVETRVTLDVDGEDIFGTSDFFAVAAPRIEVVDFKYGQGYQVFPDSSQNKIYGLGVLNHVGPFVDIRTVDLTIVQPRTDPDHPVNTVSMPVADLVDWEQTTLKPAVAKLAAGDTTETPGDHCRWCVRAGECNALAGLAQSNAKVAFGETPPDPGAMSNDELGARLEYATMMVDWYGKLRAEASLRIDHGDAVPGWKLVPKRAVRRWNDPEGVVHELVNKWMIDPMEVMRVETIGNVEKALKHHRVPKTAIDPFTIKQSSGTTLVSEKDGRPAIDNSAQGVFGEISDL
jgi:hypothetical protein